MKVKFLDMSVRKHQDNEAIYFAILPTINIVNQNNKFYLYLAWLNYLIIIE